MLPGANLSAIARGEELDPFQLYNRRRKAVASGSIAPLSKSVHVQVRFAQVDAVARPPVEIVVRDVVVRVIGDAEPDHLTRIISAVRMA
ncbi:IS66 family insertion sequence element accessory protein TnpB [Rhizobium sp. CNPSo 3968]|nr:IS66 family insertion sequence element accessory protein TnpB [Rhizobium sp. CNPSo 3968]MDK4719459.1 IS66 family insertion sequence element accessory protein TnpB [Rhizobium sp. CNPSo 3968]